MPSSSSCFLFFYRHTHTHTYSTYRICGHVYRLKVATSFVQRERKKHNFVERYSRERDPWRRSESASHVDLNLTDKEEEEEAVTSAETRRTDRQVCDHGPHATDLCSLCSIHSWLIIKTNSSHVVWRLHCNMKSFTQLVMHMVFGFRLAQCLNPAREGTK